MVESEIFSKGFVFETINVPDNVKNTLLNKQNYTDTKQESDYDVPLIWENIDKTILETIINQLKLKLTEPMRDEVASFSWDAHMMRLGDRIKRHNDANENDSLFQILVWICKEESYSGREFVHGEIGKLKRFKPKTGDTCYMDTTSLKWIHAVNTLKSDTEIVTITGYKK